jgi:predicted DNA-binding transcriptional regulator AlpA
MVDARADLAGAVNELVAKLVSQENSLRLLLGEIIITVGEIAKRQGVSRTTFYREPWRLPNYGKKPDQESPKGWYLSTYKAWMEIPAEERQKRWELMPTRERRKLGAA